MSHRRGSSKPRSRRANTRRSGLWVPLWILLMVSLLGWFGTPESRRPTWADLEPSWWPSEWRWEAFPSVVALEAGAAESAFQPWIDPAAMNWQLQDSCDTRWSEELRARMQELEPFALDDVVAFQGLVATLEELSFVSCVEWSTTDAELGLELELVLREPVACVPSNGMFYAVDAAGILLSGAWEKPMYCDGLPLPVLGPMSDASSLFGMARPGDWLSEQDHLDALGLALSLEEHLSREARQAMGRLVIDATAGRLASVSNPGIKLLLGGRKQILFGRPVGSDEPGELPVQTKWAALENCLTGDRALSLAGWGLLDLRWDNPEVDLQPVLLAQATNFKPARPKRSFSARRPAPRASSEAARSRVR